MIGFSFSSESEAADLFKKVSLRHKHAKKAGTSSGGGASSSSPAPTAKSKKKKKGAVDKSMIGAPTDFKVVAHMGFDSEKGFSSSGVDPSWERLLGQLEQQGVSRVCFFLSFISPIQLLLSTNHFHQNRNKSKRTKLSFETLSKNLAVPLLSHLRLLHPHLQFNK